MNASDVERVFGNCVFLAHLASTAAQLVAASAPATAVLVLGWLAPLWHELLVFDRSTDEHLAHLDRLRTRWLDGPDAEACSAALVHAMALSVPASASAMDVLAEALAPLDEALLGPRFSIRTRVDALRRWASSLRRCESDPAVVGGATDVCTWAESLLEAQRDAQARQDAGRALRELQAVLFGGSPPAEGTGGSLERPSAFLQWLERVLPSPTRTIVAVPATDGIAADGFFATLTSPAHRRVLWSGATSLQRISVSLASAMEAYGLRAEDVELRDSPGARAARVRSSAFVWVVSDGVLLVEAPNLLAPTNPVVSLERSSSAGRVTLMVDWFPVGCTSLARAAHGGALWLRRRGQPSLEGTGVDGPFRDPWIELETRDPDGLEAAVGRLHALARQTVDSLGARVPQPVHVTTALATWSAATRAVEVAKTAMDDSIARLCDPFSRLADLCARAPAKEGLVAWLLRPRADEPQSAVIPATHEERVAKFLGDILRPELTTFKAAQESLRQAQQTCELASWVFSVLDGWVAWTAGLGARRAVASTDSVTVAWTHVAGSDRLGAPFDRLWLDTPAPPRDGSSQTAPPVAESDAWALDLARRVAAMDGSRPWNATLQRLLGRDAAGADASSLVRIGEPTAPASPGRVDTPVSGPAVAVRAGALFPAFQRRGSVRLIHPTPAAPTPADGEEPMVRAPRLADSAAAAATERPAPSPPQQSPPSTAANDSTAPRTVGGSHRNEVDETASDTVAKDGDEEEEWDEDVASTDTSSVDSDTPVVDSLEDSRWLALFSQTRARWDGDREVRLSDATYRGIFSIPSVAAREDETRAGAFHISDDFDDPFEHENRSRMSSVASDHPSVLDPGLGGLDEIDEDVNDEDSDDRFDNARSHEAGTWVGRRALRTADSPSPPASSAGTFLRGTPQLRAQRRLSLTELPSVLDGPSPSPRASPPPTTLATAASFRDLRDLDRTSALGTLVARFPSGEALVLGSAHSRSSARETRALARWLFPGQIALLWAAARATPSATECSGLDERLTGPGSVLVASLAEDDPTTRVMVALQSVTRSVYASLRCPVELVRVAAGSRVVELCVADIGSEQVSFTPTVDAAHWSQRGTHVVQSSDDEGEPRIAEVVATTPLVSPNPDPSGSPFSVPLASLAWAHLAASRFPPRPDSAAPLLFQLDLVLARDGGSRSSKPPARDARSVGRPTQARASDEVMWEARVPAVSLRGATDDDTAQILREIVLRWWAL